MTLTRSQIRIQAGNIVGEMLGTPGYASPFMYDTCINTAADEIARATDCYAVSASTELIANQSLYAASQLYKVKSVMSTDTSHNFYLLQQMTPEGMDIKYWNWRNANADTMPRYYMSRGDNLIEINPAPSQSSLQYRYTDLVVGVRSNLVTSASRPFTSSDTGMILRISGGTGFHTGDYRIVSVESSIASLDSSISTPASSGGVGNLSAGGLILQGYGVPGDAWPADDDVCPLPERAHIAVVFRVAILRALTFKPDMYGVLDKEYKRSLTMLERETVTANDGIRHADIQQFPFQGGSF